MRPPSDPTQLTTHADLCLISFTSIEQYPTDIIQQLMAPEADIATANCVYLDENSTPTERRCDEGAWAETPESREYISKLAPDVPLFEAYPRECLGNLTD